MKDQIFNKRVKQSFALGEIEVPGVEESGAIRAMVGRERRRSGSCEGGGANGSC